MAAEQEPDLERLVFAAVLLFTVGCGASRAHDAASKDIRKLEAESAGLDLRAERFSRELDTAAYEESKLDSLLAVAQREDAIQNGVAYQLMVRRDGVLPPPPPPIPAPVVQGFADGINWMLREPLTFKVDEPRNIFVIVPRGFVTDFASVPQILHSILGSTGPHANASVIHDYLYWDGTCTQEQADNIMLIGMRYAYVGRRTAHVIHWAVRHFGGSAYQANKDDRENGLVRTVRPPYDAVPALGTWSSYRSRLRSLGVKEPVWPADSLVLGKDFKKVDSAFCAIGDSIN